MIACGSDLIIFGKTYFLLISENEFTFREIKRDGITSFIDFMITDDKQQASYASKPSSHPTITFYTIEWWHPTQLCVTSSWPCSHGIVTSHMSPWPRFCINCPLQLFPHGLLFSS